MSSKHKIRYFSPKNCSGAKGKNKKKACWKSLAKKVLFLTLLFGFLGVTIWVLFFSHFMKVEKVNVATNQLDSVEVESKVSQIIQGSYLSFIPKNNLIILSKKKIEENLREDFKTIREVEVLKVFPNEIEVKTQERESHIIWCSGGKCFLVDERADAFYELKDGEVEEMKKTLVLVTDQNERNVELGHRVAEEGVIEFYEKLPVVIKDNAHLEIKREFSTASSMSDEVRATTVDGWQIYFSTARPIENQVEALKKLLEETIPPENHNKLAYVDLRIKGKAIFKYAHEIEEPKEEESEESNGEEEEDEDD